MGGKLLTPILWNNPGGVVPKDRGCFSGSKYVSQQKVVEGLFDFSNATG